jgi:hypothetical protein
MAFEDGMTRLVDQTESELDAVVKQRNRARSAITAALNAIDRGDVTTARRILRSIELEG